MLSILQLMNTDEYLAWRAAAIPAYAEDKVASGQWTKEEAFKLAIKEVEELLPHGLDTPENYFFTLVNAEAEVIGALWFAVKKRSNNRIAYVCDIAIKVEYQRLGYGTAAFSALETEVRRLGLTGILNP